jgi:site-specific DNA recombinase
MLDHKIVIYTRYSTDMQRTESCDDQEREVRKYLDRQGIDSSKAVVLRDEAQSGTRNDRVEYSRLTEMINRREVAILAVDDQSRLSRSHNVYSFIKDLTYAGGRFISTSEGIDTDNRDWSMKTKIMEFHHSHTIEGSRDRIRRGQRGRVIAGDSAGDFSYGYRSFYRDQNWAEMISQGLRPKKGIEIDTEQADWIRTIFKWFVEGYSIRKIAKCLTLADATKGRRATTKGWHFQQVHGILNNRKYIGEWTWGEKETIHNSNGKKKQVASNPADVVHCKRPELRIVDLELWQQAQNRLKQFQEKCGYRPGQRKRGPKPPTNPAMVYPRSPLGGLLICSECRGKMWHTGSGNRSYYLCPQATKGLCSIKNTISAVKAHQEITTFLMKILTGWPEWMEQVYQKLTASIDDLLPTLQENDKRSSSQIKELTKQIENLVIAITCGGDIPALTQRLKELQNEKEEIEAKMKLSGAIDPSQVKFPTKEWMSGQLGYWAESMNSKRAGVLFRSALSKVEATAVIAPGKKRGYFKLRLSIKSFGILQQLLEEKMPVGIASLVFDGSTDQDFEIEIR